MKNREQTHSLDGWFTPVVNGKTAVTADVPAAVIRPHFLDTVGVTNDEKEYEKRWGCTKSE